MTDGDIYSFHFFSPQLFLFHFFFYSVAASRQHRDTMEARLSHIVCHGNRWLAVEVASEGTFSASPGREFVRHSASADVEEVNQEWEPHLSHSLLLFSSHCPSPLSLSPPQWNDCVCVCVSGMLKRVRGAILHISVQR